jgi:elongation factor Ts
MTLFRAILRPLGIVGAGAMRSFSAASMASIKELRAKTSAPISDCKKALEASEGDMCGAFAWLRKRGAAKASDLEKSGRAATEGLVAVHAPNDHEAAIIQGTCETDFVPRNETFQAYLHDVASSALYERVPPPPASGVHNVNVESLLSIPLAAEGKHAGASVGDALADLVGKIREKISLHRAARVAALPGVVGSYVHGCVDMDRYPGLGSSAAVVVIGCDRKLASEGEMHLAPNEAVMKVLRPLAKKLAMHVVATKPKYVGAQDIPIEVIDSERNLLRQQALDAGKPPAIVDKVVEGRIQKYLGEVALLYQPHVVEVDSPPVSAVLNAASKDISALLKEKVKLTIDGFILCP